MYRRKKNQKKRHDSRIWRALKGIRADVEDRGQLFLFFFPGEGVNSSCHLLPAYFLMSFSRDNIQCSSLHPSVRLQLEPVWQSSSQTMQRTQLSPRPGGSLDSCAGGRGTLPPKHVHTHTLLSIRRHGNGLNRTLNYSLCQINMFPSSPDRLRAGGRARRGEMSQRGGGGGRDGGRRRNATPHFRPSPC